MGTVNRTFVFDTKNFLTSETHPETGTITYTRDAAGNMKTRKDAALVTRTFTYDGLNRLTAITSGTESITYGYDKADNRISMTSPSASATYTYDAANLLTQKAETIAGMIYTTAYDYDDNDNPILLTYPSGLAVTYSYNTNNQVTSATGFGGSVTGLTYNTAGLPTAYSYTNGINGVLTYNNRNLTTRIAAGTASDTGYTYDNRGNTKTITDYLNTARNQSFTYDNLSRLLTGIGPWGTDSYMYNTAGDRTSKTVAGSATNYTYTSNRLTSATGGEAGSYNYNANGSMTGMTQGGTAYTLTYDWMHNTTSYKAGATTLAAFTYDGEGTRVTKTGSGTTTVYHTDKEGKTITETDAAGNLIADYVYVNGKLAVKIDPTGSFFYHTDPAGSPIAMTDSAGVIAWKADYKPFGEELITAATEENYKMFVGKEKDKETGLYYFGARYLQDKTARFVSVDPVGPVDERSGNPNEKMLLNPQRINRYAYALNNPYRYVDPDGNTVWDIADIGFFAHSAYKMLTEPSWENAGNLALDTVGLLPIVPSLGMIKRVGEGIDKAADVARVSKWGRSETLAKHFADHGKDFGARTPEEYANMSSDFLKKAQKDRVPTKINNDGVIRVYDSKSNTFGSYNPDGTTRTFYKPSQGQKYWERQPGKEQ